jgi:hypothetical protein
VSVTKRRDREKKENFPGKYPRAHTDWIRNEGTTHSQRQRHDGSACTRRALMADRIRERCGEQQR